MNDLTKQILLWVALAVILLAIFSQFGMRTGQPSTIDYSQFLSEVKSNNVDSVTLKGEIIEGKRRSTGDSFVTYNPETNNSALIGLLASQGVKFRGEPPKQLVGDPSASLDALVSVQRFLEVPEPVLQGGCEKEAIGLDRVLPDEREAAELGVDPARTYVLVYEDREDDLGIRPTTGALRIGPLDERHSRLGRSQDAAVLFENANNPGNPEVQAILSSLNP